MTERLHFINEEVNKVKEESEKVGLKLNIQKTKIMASSPITSWQINGKIVETGNFTLLFHFIHFFFIMLAPQLIL